MSSLPVVELDSSLVVEDMYKLALLFFVLPEVFLVARWDAVAVELGAVEIVEDQGMMAKFAADALGLRLKAGNSPQKRSLKRNNEPISDRFHRIPDVSRSPHVYLQN